VKPHTKTLSQVSPEKKVRVAPTFSVGAENSENVGFHSLQKTAFDKLAVGKKIKKKAETVFGFKKQKALLTDGHFAFRLARVNPLCGNNSR
jgi:hypothetical protein